MKKIFAIMIMLAFILATGCMTRISTGEVGVRVNASKEVQGAELQPGSWNQTFVGSVLTFPVKDIAVTLENKTPLTADNSALSDFDVTVVYALNASSVSELYTTKSKSFHAVSDDGDILLMYTYMQTLVNNASYKAVRQYKALEVTDNRVSIESKILESVNEQLAKENLSNMITLNVVQVRNILPNKEILDSATAVVRASNELLVKTKEVDIAEKEALRMKALSDNSEKSIAYMNAQAGLLIAQGIKEGKVNTIVVPSDFRGMVNVNAK